MKISNGRGRRTPAFLLESPGFHGAAGLISALKQEPSLEIDGGLVEDRLQLFFISYPLTWVWRSNVSSGPPTLEAGKWRIARFPLKAPFQLCNVERMV